MFLSKWSETTVRNSEFRILLSFRTWQQFTPSPSYRESEPLFYQMTEKPHQWTTQSKAPFQIFLQEYLQIFFCKTHSMLEPLLQSSSLKQHWESNQQWKSHIFPRAWCSFPAKINTNLHFGYTAAHTRCQQLFVWFLNVFTSSLQFTLSVLPEIISFSFCPISTFFISLLSLWLHFVYICLKFPLLLITYCLTSLPSQFHPV